MKIMITSSGRRTYLIEYFKQALDGDGEVIAGNAIDCVPSFKAADKTLITPFAASEDYIPFLLDYCRKEKVDALLSVYDVELPVLAHARREFEAIGTKIIISDERFVKICNDKWKTFLFLCDNGFNTPKTYLGLDMAIEAINTRNLQFPVIVKPRFGNGSISVFKVADMDEMLLMHKLVDRNIRSSWLNYESMQENEKVIVQEFLKGDEYGVDIINDLNGTYRSTIAKKKLGMRAGETDSAITVQSETIRREGERLGQLTKHIANLDCDGFFIGEKFYFLEMNARFGGGYPFSHAAGVNVPRAIVKWLRNEQVDDEMLQAEYNICTYKDIVIKRM